MRSAATRETTIEAVLDQSLVLTSNGHFAGAGHHACFALVFALVRAGIEFSHHQLANLAVGDDLELVRIGFGVNFLDENIIRAATRSSTCNATHFTGEVPFAFGIFVLHAAFEFDLVVFVTLHRAGHFRFEPPLWF